MRGATECAKRLKSLFSSLRSQMGKLVRPPAGDPITHMMLGILSRNTPEAKAAEGLDRLRSVVVDFNELRVIPPIELTDILGDFPDARLKCEDMSRALNAIFATEHTVSLERVAGLPKREIAAYLDKIDGLEAYTRARVRLFGLGQHAIPLDEAMWALARREEIVSSKCSLEEAQQFLERHVDEDDAVEFVCLFRKHAWNELGGAVRKGEVERILSVPPDRSARNMLQMISMTGGLEGPDALDDEELPEAEFLGEEEPVLIEPVPPKKRKAGPTLKAAPPGSSPAKAPPARSKTKPPKPARAPGAAAPRRAKPKAAKAGTAAARPKAKRSAKTGRKGGAKAKSA
jgi:endonuclease III